MPIFYHGTTVRHARLIQANGFKPRPPSKRVWFARHRSVAERRAHHKASASASDRPLVLTCEDRHRRADPVRRCYRTWYGGDSRVA